MDNKPLRWPVIYVDSEPNKSQLERFKRQLKTDFVGFFTSPDNLAKILSPALSEALNGNASQRSYSKTTSVRNDKLRSSKPKSSTKTYSAYPKSQDSDTKSVISVENPLLLGVLVDVSRSMLDVLESLPRQSNISHNQLTNALKELTEKAILYCRTPEAAQILPRFAIFMYGFGFGQLRATISKTLAKIGITPLDQATTSIPSTNVRDLFSEIAYKENIPKTPNAAEFYDSFGIYSRSLEAQLMDTGRGSSQLEAALSSISERFKDDLLHFRTSNALLLLISDGQLDDATDEKLQQTIQEVRSQGIYILSCYVSKDRLTEHKTLYADSQVNWPIEAQRLFDCASPITEEHSLIKSLIHLAREGGWHVPDHARMFIQITNSDMLQELIHLILEPLKSS